MADYAPASKLQELKEESIVPERDPTFASKRVRKAAIAAQPPAAPKVAAKAEEEVTKRVELSLLSVRLDNIWLMTKISLTLCYSH